MKLADGARQSFRANRWTLSIVFVAFVLPLMGVLLWYPMSASALSGIMLSPAIKDVSLDMSQPEATFEFSITNKNSTIQQLRLSAVDFGSLDESGGIAFLGKKLNTTQSRYALSQWISFSADTVVVAPGQKQTITAIIANKQSLSPGGHYGGIVVTPVRDGSDAGTTDVQIVPSTSLLVLLKKIGGEQYGLNIKKVDLHGNWFTFPREATIRYQNTGNVHVVPRGIISVSNPIHRLAARGIINVDSGTILPESFRRYSVEIKHPGFLLMPGRYRMSVAGHYDDGTSEQNYEVVFWYAGLPALAASLFAVGATLLLIHMYRSNKHTNYRGKKYTLHNKHRSVDNINDSPTI